MKVCLINFYNRTEEYSTRYSLATMRLAEYLMSFGYDVDLLPISLENVINYEFDEVFLNKYQLVGLSNYSWVDSAVKLVDKKIRNLNPNMDIVIGGPQVDIIDLSEWTDEYFIIGEGEEALLNLCRYIENGKKDSNFFENNINIFSKKFPSHEKIEKPIAIKNPLFTNIKVDDKKFVWYETCRGCAYSCGYCGHKTRRKVGFIDLEQIKQEIMNIGNMNFERAFVIDPNFAGTKKRAKEVIKLFNSYAPNTSLIIYLRPEFIDDESIELFKNANIEEIRIGVQTTNEKVPLWVRANSLKHINEELPKLSQNGIKWRCELIVGLPGDNLTGLKESIKFVESLNPTEYYCYHLTLIPGVKMYNLVNNFDGEYWITTDENSQAFSSNTYSHEEMIEMLNYSKSVFNEYNSNIKKLIKK